MSDESGGKVAFGCGANPDIPCIETVFGCGAKPAGYPMHCVQRYGIQ